VKATHGTFTQDVARFTASRSASAAYNLIRCDSGGGSDIEFRIDGTGQIFSDAGTSVSTPADYAEMFEWSDGNASLEDRVGMSVVLVGDKIRVATACDDANWVIGVVSGCPAMLADSGDLRWSKKYIRDEFNRLIYEADEVGSHKCRKINPNFDPHVEYVSRRDRKEWAAIGMLGKLRLRAGYPVNPRWLRMRAISDRVEEWLVR
jgi:hypothetical protein